MRPKPQRHEPAKEAVPRGENSQLLSIAGSVFSLTIAVIFFVCAYHYKVTKGTSCHLQMGTATFSDMIVNRVLKGVCGIFDQAVRDSAKTFVGTAFLAVLGIISLVIAWRLFASLDEKPDR